MSDAATLIVGPSWVGDMVMAQSLFKYLRETDPERPLDVLAPGWSLPIVSRMPEVRCGIAAETAHGEVSLATRRRIGLELRGNYDRAIVLPRSLKSALVPWFAKVSRRTGYRGEMRYGLLNDMRPFDKAALDQTVKRFLALGTEPGERLPDIPFPTLEVSADNQRIVTRKLGCPTDQPVVALMPGAEYGPAKCWPLEHFAELARLLRREGYFIWILGSAKDRAAGEAIANATPARSGILNLCGRTSLEDVIDLLAMTEQVVSNDSGLMHIAAAVGTRVHAIYGSSTPDFTPPLTAKKDIHYLRLDCSPCFARECPLGHLNCLRNLAVAGVFAAVLKHRVAWPTER
ncbi:MAG TPA: lipopolysaccharide heptosyltransferase II [Woeseiaceae bacterium]|nr:lipopolysaccharide heptosyltransferase II [Woeseiaceae bacterium]